MCLTVTAVELLGITGIAGMGVASYMRLKRNKGNDDQFLSQLIMKSNVQKFDMSFVLLS
jgi:hypothetical protein